MATKSAADRSHVIQVPSTVRVLASVAGNGETVDDRGETMIDVRKFATDPAYVEVSYGATFSLVQYETIRVDVSVRVPCYVEEIDEARIEASKIAIKAFRAETASFPKNRTVDAVRNAGSK